MVIVRLDGGLGNQMFQYALGRNLSLKNNTDLKLDLSTYVGPNSRKFELGNFNINADLIVNDVSSKKKRFSTFYTRLRNKIGIRKEFHNRFPTIKEQTLFFDESILKAMNPVYLVGFWQNEKYFLDVEDFIRSEMQVTTKPDEQNKNQLKAIENSNSVCVHVRRTDFVNNPIYRPDFDVCTPDYFEKGIELIAGKIENPVFYIFSDEPEWCMQNIRVNYRKVYVSNNSIDNPHEDMRLMYNCKHFVIANSSFSWWAAWLSTNPDKIVIAPKEWLLLRKNDIVPDRWLKM